jgi:hypothetical protein
MLSSWTASLALREELLELALSEPSTPVNALTLAIAAATVALFAVICANVFLRSSAVYLQVYWRRPACETYPLQALIWLRHLVRAFAANFASVVPLQDFSPVIAPTSFVSVKQEQGSEPLKAVLTQPLTVVL